MLLNKAINAVLTVLAGISVALLGYWLLDRLSNLFPRQAKEKVRPYLYILPAFAAIGRLPGLPRDPDRRPSFANDDSTK